MEFPAIIDNNTEETQLANVFNQFLLPYANQIDAAVGYFYYSGFDLIAPGLLKNPLFQNIDSVPNDSIRIIMSPRTDRRTAFLLNTGIQLSIQDQVKDIISQIEFDIAGKDITHISFFLELLKRKILNVRLYTEDFFHAKAYLAKLKLSNGTHFHSIVGSSNFSESGFTDNRELNLTNSDKLHYDHLLNWFQKIWNSSTVELNESLIQIVDSERNSRAKGLPTSIGLSPFEAYLFLIRHYLGELTKERLEKTELLAEFQQVGAENVLGKLEILGGAIVSDSVGLGKTFTAAEVIRRYREKGARVLIVAPPTLIPQWKETLEIFFNIPESQHIQFLSQGKLGQENGDKIQSLKGGKEFNLIIIDEAHRARNRETFLYQNIRALQPQDISQQAAVLLLTATPFNNSIRDLQNLINLCTTDAKLYAAGFSPNAFDKFHEKIKSLKSGKNISALETDFDFQKSITEIRDLLNGIMLLRMRSSIKRNYRNITIAGKPLEFQEPEVRKLNYSYTNKQHELFQELSGFLEKLHLPHIILSNPESGRTLSYLYLLLLYKRIESSLYAFYCSLLNIIEKENELLKALDSGDSIEVLLQKYNRYRLQTEIIDPEETSNLFDGGSIPEGEESEEDSKIKFTADDVRSWISNDIYEIRNFIKRHLEPLQTNVDQPISLIDPKIETYINTLRSTRFRKCITFSEYKDTAQYIEYHLKMSPSNFQQFRSTMVTSGDPELKSKLERFAPRGQRANVAPGEEFDILIATDVLSEGVNLQDADLLLNFDLPWNPMRIVQRVGRVNRIGSENRISVLNMTPNDEVLNGFLKLLEILNSKVQQVAILLGKEMAILSSEDEHIDIREIGEEIKNVRDADSMDRLEELSQKTSIFTGIEGETEEDHFRSFLQFSASKNHIRPEDFDTLVTPNLQRTYYTILTENPKNTYSLFEIHGRRGEHKDLLSRHWIRISENGDAKEEFPYPFIESPISPTAPMASSKTLSLIELEIRAEQKFNLILEERKDRFKPGAAGKSLRQIKSKIQSDLLTVIDSLLKKKGAQNLSFDEKENSFISEMDNLKGNGIEIVQEIRDIFGRHPFSSNQLTYLRNQLKKYGINLDRGISFVQYKDFAHTLVDFYNKHIISEPSLRGTIYKKEEIIGRKILTIFT
ncbi:type III restriction endonuclease subunit R [Leptospira langatensis]|uniref:Type III restriction endonuclease subunit R n=1 Tax=Leptospira langatensis TaxID=2484983 RepID=A0A5F1ZUW9_9LEPT|nr:helicase-related protein [Leptospira langatensis]TGK00321.1 type III restriction endonuclease subunit R [Leptospira langatensis]TGL41042.1 type III restriction endonuclease subunit R [Leptospira langatensis]